MGVRGHGSGEGERPGEMGAFPLFLVSKAITGFLDGACVRSAFSLRPGLSSVCQTQVVWHWRPSAEQQVVQVIIVPLGSIIVCVVQAAQTSIG